MTDTVPAAVPAIKPEKKKPFLGYAIQNGKIRYLSAKQVLQADPEQEGCLRKYAYAYVFGKKLARADVLDKGVDLAEITEHYLTTGVMVLPPVLHPAMKFFPDPRNAAGQLDLICEEPLGDIEAAIKLRDAILRSPNAPNLAAAQAHLEKVAGLTARGIPFDGAADWVHRRGTYKDKEGVLRSEPAGLVVVAVGDLKSTSRIKPHQTPKELLPGWAQTDAEVVRDPQMVGYSKHRLRLYPDATHARTEKVYAQKKPFAADIRGGLASRQRIDDRWGEIEDTIIDQMIAVAGATKIEDVPPSTGSCDSYTHLVGCGFAPSATVGCGIGCYPGKMRTGSVVDGKPIEIECPSCKGKGKTQRGCGYRYECPLSTENIQIPLTGFSGGRDNSGETGMSLFDRISPSTDAAPVAPTPPPSAEAYDAQVAAEQAALLAEMNGHATAPAAPVPPIAPTTPPPVVVVPTLGEKISVQLCVPGDEYMVDCEDGHAPYRMKYRETLGGKFKFVDAMGALADLAVTDHVFRLPPQVVVTPITPTPTPPPAKQPCGAPGCGVGCQPGFLIVEGTHNAVYCPGCAGKGAVSTATLSVRPPDAPRTPWVDQQDPLSDEEIAKLKADPNTDPELLRLVIEHKKLVEARALAAAQADPANATRGGNCSGSGQVVLFAQQPSVVDGKVVCSVCGAERPIPKEIKKARPMPTEMPFPNHRRPKVDAAAPTPPATPTPTSPVVPTAVPASPVPVVQPETVVTPTPPIVPVPPIVVAEHLPASRPAISLNDEIVTVAEIEILSGLFRDRALAIPRAALSADATALLRRLRLVD